MRYYFLLASLVFSITVFSQSTVESIPNQKLINNSYVSNPDQILSETTVAKIDSILSSLEKNTSVQVAVVAVNSIGDEDVFEFSQKLFTKWGVGNNEKDNGLLLLLVKDKHVIRFHTGYGVEGALPDVICKRIQTDFMVPEFKSSNYDGGVLAGIEQVNKILTDPAYAEELKGADEIATSDFTGLVILLLIFVAPVLLIVFFIKASRGRFKDSKSPEHTDYPEMRTKRLTWLIEFIGIPVLIVTFFGVSEIENATGNCFFLLYLYFMGTQFYRLWMVKEVINRFLKTQSYYEIVQFLRKDQYYWLGMAILFPIPFLFYFIYHLLRKRLYRNHPRSCKQCNGVMHKLNEKDDDQFLSKQQQMEEALRSIDYDVWQCESCKATEEWLYPNRSSKYSACPKCNTWAYHLEGRKTLVSATYSSSGEGEETHKCKFCGFSKKSTYTIAQLVESTSSGSSSSFDSSSSSSGGSWGGGSSGGGGASSSW
jgi:uncharacterized protein